jgi:chromosome segregation ATPase
MSKILKATFYIFVAIFIAFFTYMVFFYHPEEVKAIMEKHETQKADFQSKIKAHEKEEKRLKEEMAWQDAIIDEAQEATDKAEKELEESNKKYKEIEDPVDPASLPNLKKCREEYAALAKGVGVCKEHVTKIKKALDACHHLNKVNLAQYANLQKLYAGEVSEGMDKSNQITAMDLTIKNLSKAKKPKLWKYVTAFLAGGLIIAILK